MVSVTLAADFSKAQAQGLCDQADVVAVKADQWMQELEINVQPAAIAAR